MSVRRLREAVKEGKEHSEVFLNYRRDGSPFMNLLMMAPLLDSRGIIRYFIGAQVDVSGLVKDSTDLEAFQRMLEKRESGEEDEPKDEFQALSEMFNNAELDTVRKYGGSMHREHVEEDDASTLHRPRLLIRDRSSQYKEKPEEVPLKPDGRLSGVYKHYLVVRPAPSLRILFSSPSLRVPGILQSRFLDRIGGSSRVRESLAEALSDGGCGVTAKIRWLANANAQPEAEEGRPRWIHCTPLLGQSGTVGVWMVVLVDDEKSQASGPARRFRQAPPIPSDTRNGQPAGHHTQFSNGDEQDVHAVTADHRSIKSGHAAIDAAVGARRPMPGAALDEQRAAYRKPDSVKMNMNLYRGQSSTDSFALG